MRYFDRGFGNRLPVEIQGNSGDFLTAKPPSPKPCIDDARRWLGCNPTRQASCPFFAHGSKLPGCATYPTGGQPHKTIYKPLRIARNKPAIDPTIQQGELDGFSIEEAS